MLKGPARAEAWEFYWATTVPVREIADAYGFDPRVVVDEVGPAEIPCGVCGKRWELRSRTQWLDIKQTRDSRCPDCIAEQQRKQREEHAAVQAREQLALAQQEQERQAEVDAVLDAMLPVWRRTAVLSSPPAVQQIETTYRTLGPADYGYEKRRASEVDALMHSIGAFFDLGRDDDGGEQ